MVSARFLAIKTQSRCTIIKLQTIKTVPSITGLPHLLSFLAYPFWRVYTHPLQLFSCVSHPTTLLSWQMCHSFPSAQWLPAAAACCIGADRFALVTRLKPKQKPEGRRNVTTLGNMHSQLILLLQKDFLGTIAGSCPRTSTIGASALQTADCGWWNCCLKIKSGHEHPFSFPLFFLSRVTSRASFLGTYTKGIYFFHIVTRTAAYFFLFAAPTLALRTWL